ncbi:uncharacterized protein PGTG_19911 [Puccinia graminis f. sp. tritici CRL 75-36-700-3]|uniref:Uncharacterized protein n=1 Tax=Puccinia graminis f. sp. tritici (strain CRL 75-36-700-3 / race SCCL) TaxID=418459 RepID=E3LBE7_PUCGT|nr:uncharacterized protein PGTG_19911 [Puccinia graminis f. sp. tritici CRL 75-36-700-3]EFP93872.1 hypothetical protein PGTG_19911 [Puccinia graminis f. sp. tritici CRL 75-36-700-3]
MNRPSHTHQPPYPDPHPRPIPFNFPHHQVDSQRPRTAFPHPHPLPFFIVSLQATFLFKSLSSFSSYRTTRSSCSLSCYIT